jgi:hypothetical protein
MSGLAVPVEPFASLELSVMVRAQGLRGAGGAAAHWLLLPVLSSPLQQLHPSP